MKSNAVLTFLPLPELIVALSLAALSHAAAARGDGAGTLRPHAAARESIASCDNTTFKARVPENPDGGRQSAVPPDAEGPVLADMGLYIEEIVKINEIDNTFTVEGRLHLVWCDPRLKSEGQDQGAYELLLEENAEEKLKAIWWPDVTFANETEGRDIANMELLIHANGTVEYREKLTVVLEARYDLYKFPFDEQTLEIEIESFSWDARSLQLHVEERFVSFSENFQISEWHTDAVSTRIEDVVEIGDRKPFSEFLMTIQVSRQFGYYLWKVLFPLVILVVMCFAIFWLKNDELSSRLNVAFTGVLTVVAFQFIATGSLPKVPYITLMDAYIAFSFVVMVLAILQSIWVSACSKGGRQEAALKIDKISRWIFPLLYISGLGVLTITFMLRG